MALFLFFLLKKVPTFLAIVHFMTIKLRFSIPQNQFFEVFLVSLRHPASSPLDMTATKNLPISSPPLRFSIFVLFSLFCPSSHSLVMAGTIHTLLSFYSQATARSGSSAKLYEVLLLSL